MKYIHKTLRNPKTLKYKYKEESASTIQRKAELFNSIFYSVFAPKTLFTVNRYQNQKAKLHNFKVSVEIIENFLDKLEIKRSGGPNNLPPIFFKATKKQLCGTLNTMFKIFNRIRKLPLFLKTAAVVPVFKEDNPKLIENFRPISLLCIESEIFERFMYMPLYNHFKNFLSKNQHGFVRKRSVMTNLQHFLTEIFVAMENDPTARVIAFYSDFSKAFDTVPHDLLIAKLCDIGLGGCFLDIIYDYLNQRKQYVRIEDHTSKELQVNSRVPQGSHMWPLLFCIL